MWWLMHLMLSHKSFKLSSPFCILFFFLLLWLGEFLCHVSSSLILSSTSSNLLLTPTGYFSVQLLYSSALWLLFGTFLYFLSLSSHLSLSILLPSLVSLFMIIYWTFYQVNYLSPVHWLFFLMFYLVLSFGTYFCFFILLDSILVSMHWVKEPPLLLELLALCKRWTFFIQPCPGSWFSLNCL